MKLLRKQTEQEKMKAFFLRKEFRVDNKMFTTFQAIFLRLLLL